MSQPNPKHQRLFAAAEEGNLKGVVQIVRSCSSSEETKTLLDYQGNVRCNEQNAFFSD